MSETLEDCRKRLLFRSWHRGTREIDLLFGSFADRHVPSFDADQLAAYDRLLAEEDPDLWDWVVGGVEPRPGHDPAIIALLRQFRFKEASA